MGFMASLPWKKWGLAELVQHAFRSIWKAQSERPCSVHFALVEPARQCLFCGVFDWYVPLTASRAQRRDRKGTQQSRASVDWVVCPSCSPDGMHGAVSRPCASAPAKSWERDPDRKST